MKNCYAIFILVLLLNSCISDFTANLTGYGDLIVVVEGDIVENSMVEIILSRNIPLDTQINYPLVDLFIHAPLYVVGSNGYKSEQATYHTRGLHQVWVGEMDENVEYWLEFEHEGEIYLSNPTKPIKTPPIDSLSWKQATQQGNVTIRISTHDPNQNGPAYFLWQYEEAWEYTPKLLATTRCWNSWRGQDIKVGTTESAKDHKLVNYPFIANESNNNRFSVLYWIKIKQIAVSKEGYEYFTERMKQSEDIGGLFSPQPIEPIGNIICKTNPSKKTIGFINVLKNSVEAELWIDGNSISKKENDLNCEVIQTKNPDGPGYPYILYQADGGIFLFIHQLCITCGFGIDKPVFWPK